MNKGPQKTPQPGTLWYFESYEGFRGSLDPGLWHVKIVWAPGVPAVNWASALVSGVFDSQIPNPEPQTVTSPNPKTQTPGL